jgi:drug/metabolite transporter (DMT)-like permease
MIKQKMLNWIFLSMLVIFWGSTFALTKFALATYSPLWIVAIRLLSGFIVIYILLRLNGENLPTGIINWIWLTIIGLTASIPFFLICWSTQYIDTGIGGVLFGIGPLFTAFIAHFFIVSERINFSKVLGLIIGFIGICILLNKDLIHALDSNINYLLPQIAIIIAAMGYSIQIICVRIMPDISLLQKTSGGFLVGAIISIILALLSDGLPNISLTDSAFLSVLVMGFFSTAMAGLVMFHLSKIAGPTFVSITHYLLPPYVVILGVIVLNEKISIEQIIAVLVIIIGIVVSRRKVNLSQ